jgi:hypothetical protein
VIFHQPSACVVADFHFKPTEFHSLIAHVTEESLIDS